MCGISAVLSLSEGSICPQALASQMNESLQLIKHRGPDARGQWLSSDYRVGEWPLREISTYGLIVPSFRPWTCPIISN
jgi:asparagine synthetase B (glutamine-hydrolysing)